MVDRHHCSGRRNPVRGWMDGFHDAESRFHSNGVMMRLSSRKGYLPAIPYAGLGVAAFAIIAILAVVAVGETVGNIMPVEDIADAG